MIRITTQSNIKCIKCNCCPEKLVKIGAFYMCQKCFNEEFVLTSSEIKKFSGIDPKSKLGEVYHKWLKIYFSVFISFLKEEEDEYFDTN